MERTALNRWAYWLPIKVARECQHRHQVRFPRCGWTAIGDAHAPHVKARRGVAREIASLRMRKSAAPIATRRVDAGSSAGACTHRSGTPYSRQTTIDPEPAINARGPDFAVSILAFTFTFRLATYPTHS
jgi:hypothetical protein